MNRSTLNTKILLLSCAAALVVMPGCAFTASPKGKPMPQISFAHLAPLSVNVRDIVQPSVTEDYIGGDFAVSPAAAARQYFAGRFRPVGIEGALKLYVADAQVKSAHKKQTQKIANFFNVGGHNVYDVSLTIRLEHVADDGRVIFGKAVTARRTMNIDEHAPIAEREAHQLSAMEAMFRELDTAVVKIIQEEMRLTF